MAMTSSVALSRTTIPQKSDDVGSKTLGLVKNTPFEQLADQIKEENEIRDRHISCLEKIMKAYSYLRCVLELSKRIISVEDVVVTCNYIDDVIDVTNDKNNFIKRKERIDGECFYALSYYPNSYIWMQCGFVYREGNNFRGVKDYDRFEGKSKYWYKYRKENSQSQMSLSGDRLQEDLWDQEKLELRYDILPEFIKNYPWVFPPNVVELHREMMGETSTQGL